MSLKKDRGATAITVAISMVVLLGMGAVVLDLSAGWNERRQDQTASDLSSVAGALSYGFEQTNEAIVTNALETARANLTEQYSGPNDPGWIESWRDCRDPDQLEVTVDEPAAWNAIGTPNPGNELECISYNTNFFRVVVPVQETDTSFGRILGLYVLRTDADTIVTYEEGASGFLPFAIVANEPDGEICLDTGPSPDPDSPCEKNDRGSFGALLPPQWGHTGLPQYCPANGNGDAGLAEAVANGVDHLIRPYLLSQWSTELGDPDVFYSKSEILNSSVNVDLCTITTTASAAPADLSHDPDVIPINGVVIDTGNSSRKEISDGLVSEQTFSGKTSRLQQLGSGAPFDDIIVYNGTEQWLMDNTPLWYWLDISVSYNDNAGGAPKSCAPAIIDDPPLDGSQKNLLMVVCLQEWAAGPINGSYVPIFTDEKLLDASRFGVAPQLWNNNLGSGFQYRPVREFRPVYIAGIDLTKKKGGFWYTNGTDEPGDVCLDKTGARVTPLSGCVSLDVDQVTAYLLPRGSWSSAIGSKLYPGVLDDNFVPTIRQ